MLKSIQAIALLPQFLVDDDIRAQRALGGRGGKRNADETIFMAFDLLYLDGHDLTRMGQRERREMLQDLLEGHEGAIKFSESIDADGERLLRSACELGHEGIIAKHGDRP